MQYSPNFAPQEFSGGTSLKPRIKGIDRPNVVTAEDILLGKIQPADQIVVAGGGEVRLETAAHLAIEERDVTVVEMKHIFGEELIAPLLRNKIFHILDEYNAVKVADTKILEFLEDGVLVENDERGQYKIPAQQIVLALGYKPVNNLELVLKSICNDVVIVGGAVKTSNAAVAACEGFFAGMNA